MAEGMGLREFGRQLGVTAEAVRKAIADGRIPKDCVGQRQIGNKGRVWPVILDPERAASHWGRNRDPSQVRDKAALSAGARRSWANRRGEDPLPDDADPGDPPDEPVAAGTGLRAGSSLPDINESKRREAAAKAHMAVLDLKERQGELVNARQVKARLIQMITTAKTRLLSVPSKAKTKIPTLTVDDIETLEEMIVEALEGLAADDGR